MVLYGAFIPDSFLTNRAMRTPNASFSPANPVIGEHGFSPDTAPIEYGTSGAGDFRIATLEIENANGDSVTDIRYTGYKIYDGKKEIPGIPSSYVNNDREAQTLEIYTEDSVTGAKVTLYYTVFPAYDVITRRVRVTNSSTKKMRLARAMSFCLDLPEMISPDSELFRAHPDWCVRVADREPMLGRNQYVIDMSREDVRNNIWEQMYKVLSQNNIEYLKWDFNRNISDAGSALLPPARKMEFFHRFILGTYDLMNRLVTTFPNILFENCSGGGGRFDPAMLCYSPQIWASDNTDPIDRLYIQFGTSMSYPASVVGAHVSASNRAGYETKCNVARWGTFGLELDPTKLTDNEADIIRNQIKKYHRNYELVNRGDLYRLISPFENSHRAAWQLVLPDKSRTMVMLVRMQEECHQHLIVRLRGLDPDAYYKNEQTGEVLSGALLMNAGLVLTSLASHTGESLEIYFDKISENL